MAFDDKGSETGKRWYDRSVKTLVMRNRRFILLCAVLGVIMGLIVVQFWVGTHYVNPADKKIDALRQYVDATNANLTRSINDTNAKVAENKAYMKTTNHYSEFAVDRTLCLRPYIPHLRYLIETNKIQIANISERTRTSRMYESEDSSWDDDTPEEKFSKCMEQAANTYNGW